MVMASEKLVELRNGLSQMSSICMALLRAPYGALREAFADIAVEGTQKRHDECRSRPGISQLFHSRCLGRLGSGLAYGQLLADSTMPAYCEYRSAWPKRSTTDSVALTCAANVGIAMASESEIPSVILKGYSDKCMSAA
jgi:hypothetical protein